MVELLYYLQFLYRLLYFVPPILAIVWHRYDMILLYTLILSVIHLVKVIVNYYLVQKYRHNTGFPEWVAEQNDKVLWLYLKHFKLENKFDNVGKKLVNSRLPQEYLRITIPIYCLLYMIVSKSWSGFTLASLAISYLYLYFTVYPSSIPLLDTRPYCGNIPMSILLVVCLGLSYCRLRRL